MSDNAVLDKISPDNKKPAKPFDLRVCGSLCTTRNLCLVPRAGIEPARSHPHRILNPARLPVPPPRQRIRIIRKVVTKSQLIFKGVLTVVN